MGCLGFAHTMGELDKFEPKAIKCVLLGYSHGFKNTNFMLWTHIRFP